VTTNRRYDSHLLVSSTLSQCEHEIHRDTCERWLTCQTGCWLSAV